TAWLAPAVPALSTGPAARAAGRSPPSPHGTSAPPGAACPWGGRERGEPPPIRPPSTRSPARARAPAATPAASGRSRRIGSAARATTRAARARSRHTAGALPGESAPSTTRRRRCGAQDLVAADQLAQRAPHRVGIVRATQPDHVDDVVDGTARRELIQEPELLLSKGEGARSVLRAALDPLRRAARALGFGQGD